MAQTYYTYNPGGGYDVVSSKKAENDIFADDVFNKVMKGAANQPTFESLINPDGTLKTDFMLQGKGDVGFRENEALDVLKDRATATGPSQWAQLMQQLIGEKKLGAMDDASAQGNAATAQGMSSLATRGGLSKGARERMATKGAMNTLMAKQQVGRNAMTDELSMLADDEKTKTGLLSTWAGLNEQSLNRNQNLDLGNREYGTNIDQFNLKTKLDDRRANQTFDMAKWQEGMKALGSYQTARAQEEAGKK